jgi:hypothetical protein
MAANLPGIASLSLLMAKKDTAKKGTAKKDMAERRATVNLSLLMVRKDMAKRKGAASRSLLMVKKAMAVGRGLARPMAVRERIMKRRLRSLRRKKDTDPGMVVDAEPREKRRQKREGTGLAMAALRRLMERRRSLTTLLARERITVKRKLKRLRRKEGTALDMAARSRAMVMMRVVRSILRIVLAVGVVTPRSTLRSQPRRPPAVLTGDDGFRRNVNYLET